jgi:hypothetical protein
MKLHAIRSYDFAHYRTGRTYSVVEMLFQTPTGWLLKHASNEPDGEQFEETYDRYQVIDWCRDAAGQLQFLTTFH